MAEKKDYDFGLFIISALAILCFVCDMLAFGLGIEAPILFIEGMLFGWCFGMFKKLKEAG